MTIVCATHFSDPSMAAVKVASRLARNRREALWLVEVVLPAAPNLRVPRARPALARASAELARRGVEVNVAALSGPLAPTLQQFCAATGAGLLLIADTRQTLATLNVGPLDRFADRIGVPVLIVRDARPFTAWAQSAASLKVMLALDRTWRSPTARNWISGLAAHGAVDLFVSHLRGPHDTEPPDDADDEALHALPSNVTCHARLEKGGRQTGALLLRLAAADRVDVVVLGTHPHRRALGQQWSLSHEVLALAPMSVACVPDRAVERRPALPDEAEAFGTAA